MSSCLPFSIYSLEVIPADSYQVQKVGDDTTGFVTKVVVKNEQEQKDSQTPNASTKDSKKPSSDEEGKLSKKERQKLKRKAKKEAAIERKRLKKEQGGEGQAADNKSGDSNTTKKPAQVQDTTETAADESLQQEIEQLQTSWSISAVGVTLHTTLCTGLHSLKYTYPTPIQSSTLSAAILGRRDIVGAAPTGSGKTLSFGLPILQYLLEEADRQEKQEAPPREKLPLQALILTPTRELAMQVTEELKRTSCNKVPIGTIVGGFAEVKQKRVLEKTRPPILVATPGRLWELVSSFFYCWVYACVLLDVSMKKQISHGLDSLNWNVTNLWNYTPIARQSERIRNKHDLGGNTPAYSLFLHSI